MNFILNKGKSKLHFEKVIIPREVVHATYNDLFIFAKQRKNGNSTDTTYYIINKLRDKVISPLNLDSFEKIKASASTH